ncbi:1-acyl-sn-glycerol-3-phosphate acyltransferase [Geomonas sp. RF6]|uniref:lysophospholipid acyltransferase family protein n=1 Tax=Geomonas sp. RF6 TaxID=2897342 RepID=UPI001E4A8E47|nr:lysophospholipid acyltransferase family protein [Geomonas sp. RF6]UFS69359.1 1-acyl-sn-glycerol-3-phosphate acyltransferase [Geomonas sp. RF6]
MSIPLSQCGARRGGGIEVLLLNLFFFPMMILWTALGIAAAPFCLVLLKLFTRWDWGRVVRTLIGIHGHGVVLILSPFVSFTGEGLEEISYPCILVVNHLSFFDSYFMAELPSRDIVFAVGAWPFKMYWYTFFMRLARYLDVESTPWDEVIGTCKETFGSRGAVLFFPEGHRSRNGKLQQFHSGAFRLASETGIPIVPLCITGTDTLLPPKHYLLHPAKVRLKALPPVDPKTFPGPMGHLGLRRHLAEVMARGLAEMRGERS